MLCVSTQLVYVPSGTFSASRLRSSASGVRGLNAGCSSFISTFICTSIHKIRTHNGAQSAPTMAGTGRSPRQQENPRAEEAACWGGGDAPPSDAQKGRTQLLKGQRDGALTDGTGGRTALRWLQCPSSVTRNQPHEEVAAETGDGQQQSLQPCPGSWAGHGHKPPVTWVWARWFQSPFSGPRFLSFAADRLPWFQPAIEVRLGISRRRGAVFTPRTGKQRTTLCGSFIL